MLRVPPVWIVGAIVVFCGDSTVLAQPGAETLSFYGYDDCIRLSNGTTRVTLCPAAGGRVLEYSLDGVNVLYLPPGDEGWRDVAGASKRGTMNAGRFDIGPEKMVKRGRVLWQGEWKGQITGPRAARLVSQFDPESGVRLIRTFELHASSSRLRCSQTIRNESKQPVDLCYWSRTFAVGGGIVVVPRSRRGRFPDGVVMYRGGNEITIAPDDANLEISDAAVVVKGPPEFPKLGFDSHAGWLAYLAPTDQMFVKRFKTFPDRAYNEFAGLTLSVWYPTSDRVELEPIGPAEHLDPGQQATFAEEWWLLPHAFPVDDAPVKFSSVEKRVRSHTVPALEQPEPPRSPEVDEDRRVTFRFQSSSAKRVRAKLGADYYPLQRTDGGWWQLTTQPLTPGIHEYLFEVDGSEVTDPRNRWVKKWKVCRSLVEIPGDPPLPTERRQVPHGILHHHTYASKTVDAERAAIVYTPPGYGDDPPQRYPLLVLCHGNGDDQTAWVEVGRMHWVLDNLIAEGKIEPMVVVMPNGHPIPLEQHEWNEDYRSHNRQTMKDDVVSDLLPFVATHYRVYDRPEQRAIAGLSMGGGQSIAIGMSHPELFRWIGAFSAAAPQGKLQTDHPTLLVAPDQQAKRQLFWIACGSKDFLLARNRAFVGELETHQIQHRYVETPGAHSWDVWRRYLVEFLPLLFRQQ